MNRAAWPIMAETAPNEPVKTAQIAVLPPEAPAPVRKRTKLGTIREIRAELARVYRKAKSGEIDTTTATRLSYILDLMSRMIERGELEQRIADLENGGRE